jgi:beta-phosphoglucomutase family hydrolase
MLRPWRTGRRLALGRKFSHRSATRERSILFRASLTYPIAIPKLPYTGTTMLEERMAKSPLHRTLKLPAGRFKAYLFDCDGTIADSMPLHYIAWKKALGEWNCEFDEELFYAWGGMPIVEIISTLNEKRGLSMPIERVAHRKESLYFELLPQLKAIPEVLEHIEARHGQIPFAVVSGSTRESVTASLTSLNLLDRFDTMVCAGDYEKSKPDPEAFLLAATNLGVAPEDCLVFEDTEMGIQAATAAGMASVKIPPPWERSLSRQPDE